MRFILATALLLFFPFSFLLAQQFGGNPPSLKWQQINTDSVRVIFPRGMSQQGERVANIVDYLNRYTRASIGNQQRKVSIVLQNQTMESNGYVQLGPFRSEFYLAPAPASQDLGSLNWVEQLSLHEYRHVLQNNNFRQGISKVASYVFGELGQAAVTNIAVPNWFWEGDAVVMETALSPQGRGRLPAFFDGFRGLTLAGKDYSFMKIRNGSYRDFVPNHYPLGYLLNTYGRNHYGQTFWKDVTSDAVRYKGLFYPFSRSLKKRTGKNITAFYTATLEEYASAWKDYAARKDTTAAVPLLSVAKPVTNYKYVYAAGNNEWVVLKDAYNKIPGIFLLDAAGKEKLLVRPGLVYDDFFSYKNGRIVWAAARFDVRWGWKDFSVIRVWDNATGRTKTVAARGKYFSPDISANGQQVIAAAITPDMQYSLQLINTATGTVTKKLPNPENWYYTYPRFTAGDEAVISAVRNVKGEMALVQQSLSDGTATLLTPFSYTVIGIPAVSGDTIYFTAGGKDVNNVYALTLSDKKTYAITDRGNSALHMALDADKDSLVFSEFTAKGYKLYHAPVQATAWKQVTLDKQVQSAWIQPEFAEGGSILDKVTHDSLPVKKYPLFTRPFNFHSWVPSFADPNYSISLRGENVLNTTSTSIGYTYNRNEGYSRLGGDFTFGGWFPYLTTGVDYTINRNALTRSGARVYWNEATWYAGFSVPLNLSSGLYSRSITLGSKFNLLQDYFQDPRYRDNRFQYLSNRLIFNNQRARAKQHINTHFGQYLVLQYNHSLGDLYAEQLYARLDQYLPGLWPNHSLVLQGAYQERDKVFNYSFSDNFVYARGYNTPFYNRIYKLGANYHLPLFYPDWGFAQILYFSRIRTNLFYDYSQAYDFRVDANTRFTSAGAELYFDTRIGNTIPFTWGVRFSHLLDKDPVDNAQNRVEFMLPIQQLFKY
ncbi:hypothetical protein [Chitinophaga nivalis]|uniref:Peptidase M1 membrane alanine aminopeptidase domain-containing protein n=1 Tax=Chitinophaga nivalis TaxID=2991709 RepID=A0ABT3IPW0_9BACT|nr:hypothetical protein [Chitinophaga nivalis]MCW3464302.1 hypothetical protein [Chitinophaga nivalis]MCW3486007.1 hypothetical protein [Chitinophaga nivalis]